jgi:hypothetical protein
LRTIKSDFVLVAALAFLPSLHAAIVFTDFQNGICCSVGANNATAFPQSLAGQFVPNANYIMADAQVKVEESGTAVPTFNLFLYSDNSGVPGASLGMIGGGTAPSAGSFNIVLVGSPAFSLLSGTPYWLVMTPNAGSNVIWAGGGSPSPASVYDQNATGSSPWLTTMPAAAFQFQIDGTPTGTPEPSTSTLILSGLGVALLVSRFRKTRAVA